MVFHNLKFNFESTFVVGQAQEEQRTERAREALHDESVLQIRMPASLGMDESRRRLGSRFSPFSVMSVPNRLRKESSSFLSALKSMQTRIPIPDCLGQVWAFFRTSSRAIVQSQYFQGTMIVVIIVNTVCLALDYHDQSLFEKSICRRRCEIDPSIPASALPHCVGPLFNRSWTFDGQGGGKRKSQTLFCFLENDAAISFPKHSLYAPGYNCSKFVDIDSCSEQPRCGWISNSCMLGLYTSTTFAANASGSSNSQKITFRDLCGGINEVGIYINI
jgi:hypothetical protein